MNAELTHHLGYEKHDPAGNNSGNSRNGTSSKTVKGNFGELEIEVPRDRISTFEPQILPKHQTRFTGFDAKIVSMYARGMTTREIEGHLKEIYNVEVSPALISQVTEAVKPGAIFVPFVKLGESAANFLTNAAFDPSSKIPEYKVCAVRVSRS